jgi:hypothetical protein
VFPVSAQKGLVAKVTHDDALLARSRLPALEGALVDLLVPAKRRGVREQTLAIIERIGGEVRQALLARERGLIEQLYELRTLQGKNQGSVDRMLLRAQAEQREFENNVRKIVATRAVMSRLSGEAYLPLRLETLRAHVYATRERMRRIQLTPQFFVTIKEYFGTLRDELRAANAKLLEIEQMVLGVQRQFAEDLGWNTAPPMPFSLDTYITELERAEAAYKVHFGALAVLTQDKWSLIERFFETVVSRSREIFSSAERDAEAWVRSLLPPSFISHEPCADTRSGSTRRFVGMVNSPHSSVRLVYASSCQSSPSHPAYSLGLNVMRWFPIQSFKRPTGFSITHHSTPLMPTRTLNGCENSVLSSRPGGLTW